MIDLPLWLVCVFLGTVLVGLVLFGKAAGGSRIAVGLTVVCVVLQSGIALRGFYLVTNTLPPRFFLVVAPPLLLIAGLFVTAAGRRFLDGMDLKWCVLLHSVRVLVELNLYCLFVYKQVPRLMTFEGGNLDILIGLTAGLAWWAYSTGRIGRRGLLIWNGLALMGVLNAATRAILSAPFKFERFGFDQPTVAILHFPFVLLPAFLVPAVILCHLVVFRKMLGRQM